MSFTQDALKAAADALRSHASQQEIKLKPTHAHEMVAAYCKYGSKVALKSDGFELDPDEPDDFESDSQAEARIRSRMTDLKGILVGAEFAYDAVKIIERAITPACNFCHHNDVKAQPVQHEVQSPQLWACSTCAEAEPEVAYCHYCGTEHIYHESLLNHAGECPEHAGESEYADDEEQDDYDSYAEYWMSH